ncbi:MAG: copper-binding protein [Hyphomonas sp.]|uniref:copper-binding protein n=1 Tax=Hyphomonas sp. TaxID=87 RepID=UPI003001693E
MNRPLKSISYLATALAMLAGAASAQITGDKMDHDRMDMPASADMRTSHMFEGVGNVVAIDLENRKIGLDHGPVPALQWPAMKMAFKVLDSVDLSSVKPGDRVQFTLHKVENGPYPIAEICLTSDTEISPGLCAAEPRAGHAAH